MSVATHSAQHAQHSAQHAQHDPAAERGVIGSILLDNAVLDEVAEVLAADGSDFYAPSTALMFAACVSVHARGEPVDSVTLRAELAAKGHLARAGGDEAILALTEWIPTPGAAETYARRVRELATVRRLERAVAGILAGCRRPIDDVDAFLDEAEATMHAVAMERRLDSRAESMRELVPRVLESMLERPGSGEVRGAPTGIELLDKAISGLQPGHLVIVAGRPGMGKSAFAGASALNVAREGQGAVLVWTGEMAREEWAERMLVSESAIDGDTIRSGRWSRSEWARIERAAAELHAQRIVVDDTPSASLWQLRSKARRLRAKDGLALIVADYLQLMRSGERTSSREQEVAAISRGLKALAKELSVPVMALSQLNRRSEHSSDKRPTMADLRESGQIEQDADSILLLYREAVYDEDAPPTVAEIIVAKQRGGRTGTVKAFFDATMVRWGNLATDEAPPDMPRSPSDWDNDWGEL